MLFLMDREVSIGSLPPGPWLRGLESRGPLPVQPQNQETPETCFDYARARNGVKRRCWSSDAAQGSIRCGDSRTCSGGSGACLTLAWIQCSLNQSCAAEPDSLPTMPWSHGCKVPELLFNNLKGHPWLIHADEWRKQPQYCKVISLQLK